MIMSRMESLIYKSTRGQSKDLYFKDVIFEGLATDGGLYIPDKWPELSSQLIESFKSMTYQQIAFHVFKPYIDESLSDNNLKQIIEDSYK